MATKPKGSKQLGDLFRRARELAHYKTITEFADVIDVVGVHIGGVESGKRMPGPELLDKMLPFIRMAEMDPVAFIYARLEAQGLKSYVTELKRGKK